MITRRLAEDKEVCVLEWDGRNMICVVLYVFNHCLVDDWCGDWCAIGVVWCVVFWFVKRLKQRWVLFPLYDTLKKKVDVDKPSYSDPE